MQEGARIITQAVTRDYKPGLGDLHQYLCMRLSEILGLGRDQAEQPLVFSQLASAEDSEEVPEEPTDFWEPEPLADEPELLAADDEYEDVEGEKTLVPDSFEALLFAVFNQHLVGELEVHLCSWTQLLQGQIALIRALPEDEPVRRLFVWLRLIDQAPAIIPDVDPLYIFQAPVRASNLPVNLTGTPLLIFGAGIQWPAAYLEPARAVATDAPFTIPDDEPLTLEDSRPEGHNDVTLETVEWTSRERRTVDVVITKHSPDGVALQTIEHKRKTVSVHHSKTRVFVEEGAPAWQTEDPADSLGAEPFLPLVDPLTHHAITSAMEFPWPSQSKEENGWGWYRGDPLLNGGRDVKVFLGKWTEGDDEIDLDPEEREDIWARSLDGQAGLRAAFDRLPAPTKYSRRGRETFCLAFLRGQGLAAAKAAGWAAHRQTVVSLHAGGLTLGNGTCLRFNQVPEPWALTFDINRDMACNKLLAALPHTYELRKFVMNVRSR
jgi:hypothetical protein